MRIYALPSVINKPASTQQAGFSYIEMLIAVTITGLIIAGLMGLVNTVTQTGEPTRPDLRCSVW